MWWDDLQSIFSGEIDVSDATRAAYSRDASLFEVKPSAVVFPKTVQDVEALVRFVSERKPSDSTLSITARSAGTDMSGGPLSESIVVDFLRHWNAVPDVGDRISMDGLPSGYAVTQPGVFYRDFEKKTLEKGYLLPSYPASRGLCAMGGIVSNDSGGEKTLAYGKTHQYVTQIKAVLADGQEHVLKPLSVAELQAKMQQHDFEGDLYTALYDLFEQNYDLAKSAKPNVSKNSAGYNVWDVWDRTTFDITKLFVGAQGTLGMMTEATFRLISVREKPYSGMLVIFLDSLNGLTDVVRAALPLEPTSVESFDDHTFRLALKYWRGFLKLFASNPFSLAFAFLPEFWMVLTRGMPKMIVLAEFEGESQAAVDAKVAALRSRLAGMGVRMRSATTARESKKWWAIRRESFNLLRQKVKGMQTAPFVDDFIVSPDRLPTFLPKVYSILDSYQLLYTIAGHVGDGNFHVIPLMHLADADERAKIGPVLEAINTLILQEGGSLTAEHNDGLIRGPYLERMFGAPVFGLFRRIKHIFDPLDIFNPGKKVEATIEYALGHIKQS